MIGADRLGVRCILTSIKRAVIMIGKTAAVLVGSALLLAGCNKSPSDKLAGRVENAADARADAMENNADALRDQAKMLDNRADAIRDTANSRADAIKAADMNVAGMSQEQRDAIVANQAAAVR